GVADPAEQRRIGECPLHGVILTPQHGGKRLRRRIEHLESAAVELGERALAPNQVERRALLRASLGEDERAVRKVKRGQPDLRRYLRAEGPPLQAPGDHQVQYEKEL